MKIVSAEEAVADIRSGDQVYVQCAAAAPSALLDALVARSRELHNVSMVHLHTEGPGPHLAPEMAPHFRHRALFIGPNARQAVNEGRAEFVPVFLSDVPHLFSGGLMPLDAVLCNVSPPDAHGYCSLGTSVEAMQAAIPSASLVIAQVNAAMPRTLGESFVHVDEIDYGVEVDIPPYMYPPPEIGEVERRIGEFAADLVPDGATLQMGIGAIPVAIAAVLRDKRDLGIHTEMMTDCVVDLVEAGVVTGMAKERNRGKIVCTFMMGTEQLYRFVNDNPMVEMRACDHTNDTHVIRGFRRMTADQLRDRDRPHGPGLRRLDRTGACTAASAARWTSSAARPWRRGAGDHRDAVDGRRRDGLAHRAVPPRRVRASSRRGRTSRPW